MKHLTTILFVLVVISALLWSGVRIYQAYDFSVNCSGHLKRAGDANTVELAKQELETAISYLENEGLTEGVVSIFLHQPINDIGFWYTNLKVSYDELENLNPDTTQLEMTNVLMKLRETLLDDGESGDVVTYPNGISIYPSNVMYFWWGFLSWIFAFILGIYKAVFDY